MRFNRLRLQEFVRKHYPFHKLEDAIEFAWRDGLLVWSEWLCLTGVDDDNLYEK